MGTAVIAVHALLPASVGRELLYAMIGAAALGGFVVGVLRGRPTHRPAWILLGAGMAAWVLGDIVWIVLETGLGIDQFPSAADVLYLLGYPALAGGLYLVSRARNGGGDLAVLDALVTGVAVALVMWVAFIEPTWTAAEGTMIARLVAAAYPIGDVVLIVQLVNLGGSGLRRSRSLRLIGGALVLVLLGDLIFQASL
ncbi:MAG: hypothetical protein IMZ71_05660, partial [Chloroflexi bacterium]|nr:hypothetical protein [Chloroflexota bacterium]